ncbi:unnamed protein product [Phytophthora fragariaefolia]|uniref:Unnamed protein product n=1 Tax=Phytophthora fragariaefolia TaxID=1490495 RepID=A0A9W6U997_9STRA|nr:unnamed protein product [Phytophthora fragariaefolia]
MARIRSSSASRKSVVSDVVRTTDFKHLWRQLRAAGWRSKRPSGLSNQWIYTSPDGESFAGEHAVVAFAFQSGLVNEKGNGSSGEVENEVADSEAVTTSEAVAMSAAEVTGEAEAASEAVPASQIDTSIALSANTIGVIDFCRAESNAESSEEAEVADDGDGGAEETVMDDIYQIVVPPNDVNVLGTGDVSDDYESVGSSGIESSCDNRGDEEVVPREFPDYIADSDEEVAHMDDAFIQSLGGKLTLEAIDQMALREFEWGVLTSEFETGWDEYPHQSKDVAAPKCELEGIAHSPVMLFFYFVPKSLWVSITKETNRYKKQTLRARAHRVREKQRKRQTASVETVKQIERRLRAEPLYEAHELLHVIGLLIARMLNPMTRRLSRHWSMSDDGAIPAGNFGRYMPRNRCTSILRDVHFVNNEAPRVRDNTWKLRPVVDMIQSRFLSGWSLPSKFSFDEGVLPATSKRNTTRMFMSDKPHRYGTKIFMVCDLDTAYCHRYLYFFFARILRRNLRRCGRADIRYVGSYRDRFEIYVGKREAADTDQQAFNNKTGAAAVIRNLKIVLQDQPPSFRMVVVDRFYTSVALTIQLLSMSVYVLGTITTNRLGYDKRVVEHRQTRPRQVERGSFTYSRSAAVPTTVACHWWDRKPLHYLATEAAMTETFVHRNLKGVGSATVKCPKLVADYQRWMGGVDVHDQLRLQSYSLQKAIRFQKYYKSLFIGLLDIAMVNWYLTHKHTCQRKHITPMDRRDWYVLLHKQLLQLKPDDFVDEAASTPLSVSRGHKRRRQAGHAHLQLDDWVTVSGVQKRRQRSCKGFQRPATKSGTRTLNADRLFQTHWANALFCVVRRRLAHASPRAVSSSAIKSMEMRPMMRGKDRQFEYHFLNITDSSLFYVEFSFAYRYVVSLWETKKSAGSRKFPL